MTLGTSRALALAGLRRRRPSDGGRTDTAKIQPAIRLRYAGHRPAGSRGILEVEHHAPFQEVEHPMMLIKTARNVGEPHGAVSGDGEVVEKSMSNFMPRGRPAVYTNVSKPTMQLPRRGLFIALRRAYHGRKSVPNLLDVQRHCVGRASIRSHNHRNCFARKSGGN